MLASASRKCKKVYQNGISIESDDKAVKVRLLLQLYKLESDNVFFKRCILNRHTRQPNQDNEV